MGIVYELATFDEAVQKEENVANLIHSLLLSFETLAIVSSMNNTSFAELESAVQAKISRRKNKNDKLRQ